jgi:hypothetical protein
LTFLLSWQLYQVREVILFRTLRTNITDLNAAKMKDVVDFILKKAPEWVQGITT